MATIPPSNNSFHRHTRSKTKSREIMYDQLYYFADLLTVSRHLNYQSLLVLVRIRKTHYRFQNFHSSCTQKLTRHGNRDEWNFLALCTSNYNF